ncbi:MAG: hypothetical protein AAFY78_09900 [Cyanobacteria bacterium J06648_16]
MAQVVLSQLVEAEAQLAEQETIISAQLADLREKIKGLQTVMAMFDGESTEVTAVADVEDTTEVEVEVEAPVKSAEPAAKKPASKRRGRPKKTETATAAKSTTTRKKSPATKSPAAKSTATKSPATKATAAKKATTTRKAPQRGKAAKWQRYIRDEFSSTPLPDVVANILKSQPKSTFKIAAVMSEIFPEDMPKAQFLKARNRVSNILSAGARSGEWYRGRGGTYSCSKKVAS